MIYCHISLTSHFNSSTYWMLFSVVYSRVNKLSFDSLRNEFCLARVNSCHAGPVYIQKLQKSLWSQMPWRQVGADPSVPTMVFHAQCNIFPSKSAPVLPNFIEILSKADDTQKCRLLFSNNKQHVMG